MNAILPTIGLIDPGANPYVGRLASEILDAFSARDAEYDSDRLSLLERILSFAANAEQELAAQRKRIAELEALIKADELTGLSNRRGLEEEMTRLISSARRYDEQGVVCYLDIDDFKQVNDRWGHQAGDQVLRNVADTLVKNTRANDIVARVGGDEFIVVLTRASIADGLEKARAMQQQLDESTVDIPGGDIPVKVSVGVQGYDGDTEVSALLNNADHAMYVNKRARKSCLVPIYT